MTITLHPHQKDARKCGIKAIKKGKGQTKGRFVIPTGGGKTFIEASLLDYQRTDNSYTRIHLVLAPRILLANQLINEYRKFSGPVYGVVAFHSGNLEQDPVIAWKEPNTTKVSEVELMYIEALKRNQDLVVFSTYHSAIKLAGIKFDTMIADESQYCVAENFNDSIKDIDARVKFFFTATEKFTASENGRGLNNSSFYGKRLFYISPAELIKLGLIVPPRLHVMWGETKNEEKSIISEVIEVAAAQHKLTMPDLGFSKILFAMKGTDDVKTVEDSLAKIRQALPEPDVFTITSKFGAKINGAKIRREDFLDKLKDSKNCLIFHYDILSEGIDVDGITGVCLMRNLGLAKLLQTIGRAIRIYKLNPSLKKQAWISVAVLNGNEDDKERVKYFVEAIRNSGFDISSENIVETGIPRHSPDQKGVDDAYGALSSNFSNLFITDVIHEIEQDEFWNTVNAAGDVNARFSKFLEVISTGV